MPIGRSDVNMPRLNQISIVRMNGRERADSREDLGQMAFLKRREMEHDEEARTNIWPKSFNRLFQGIDSASGCTHHHNVTL